MTPIYILSGSLFVLTFGLWYVNRRMQVEKIQAIKTLLSENVCLTKNGLQLYNRGRNGGYSILDFNEPGFLVGEKDFHEEELDTAIQEFLEVSGNRKR